MTVGQGFDIGPFSFTVIRVLVLVGFIRIVVRGERLSGGINLIDSIVILWGLWGLFANLLHPHPSEFTLVYRIGMVYNVWGIYFLIRILCGTAEEVIGIIKLTAILLVPLALEMLNQKMTGSNSFSLLGGVSPHVTIRDGVLRAQGPFRHAILAGTVGATCFPLMIGIWSKARRFALLGAISCAIMVFTSASSGPIASLMAAIFALVLWKYRHLTSTLCWAAVFGYVFLEIVMNRPAYYIITYADLTGSSTGWHRARLIESAMSRLDEWWLAGTNYTRHWMPTGVSWSSNHADITNYYLSWGVKGGLLWMGLFIAILILSFIRVGRTIRMYNENGLAECFLVWCFGASLFAHAATSISVSYFDQSFLFIFLTIGVISSLYSTTLQANIVTSSKEQENAAITNASSAHTFPR
ncbi:MAG: hypothetical protein CMK36_08025 [Porticoccaceae bacterium]|nr:hypothetical protein [Porticoccaceae bacterium]